MPKKPTSIEEAQSEAEANESYVPAENPGILEEIVEEGSDILLGASAADIQAAYDAQLYKPKEEAFVNPRYNEWKDYLGNMAAQTLDPSLAQGYLKDTYREALGEGDIASRYGAMANEQAMRAAMQGMAGAPQQTSLLAGLAAGQQAQEQAGAKTAEVAAQEQNAAINQLSQLTSFYLSQGLDLDTAAMQAQVQLEMIKAGMASQVAQFQMQNQQDYSQLYAAGLQAGAAGLGFYLDDGNSWSNPYDTSAPGYDSLSAGYDLANYYGAETGGYGQWQSENQSSVGGYQGEEFASGSTPSSY